MKKSRLRIEQEYRQALEDGELEDVERVLRLMYEEGSDYSDFLSEVHAETSVALTLREIDESLEDESLRGLLAGVMAEDF